MRRLQIALAASLALPALASTEAGPDPADLLTWLRGPDPETVARARDAILQQPAVDWIEPLRRELREGPPAERAAIASVMASWKDRAAAAAPELVALLADPDATVRAQAKRAIASMPSAASRTVPALLARLPHESSVPPPHDGDHHDEPAAVATIAALAQLDPGAVMRAIRDSPESVPLLVALLGTDRGAPASIILAAAPAALVVPQVRDLLHEGKDAARVPAARLLRTHVAGDAAFAELVDALKSADPALRAAALQALATASRRLDAVPPYALAAAGDPDERVQLAAVHAIGILNAPGASHALLRLASSGSSAVTEAALATLLELPAPDGADLPDIEMLLRDGRPQVAASALAIVGRMGPAARAAFPSVRDLLDDPALAATARRVAAVIDPEGFRGEMLRWLRGGDEAARIEAAYRLGELGGAASAALDELRAASASPDPALRYWASRAVHAIEVASGEDGGAAP